MKVKTSITLSSDVLDALDRLVGHGTNRSQLIERAVREFIDSARRRERDAVDRKILDKYADAFASDMEETLGYQISEP